MDRRTKGLFLLVGVVALVAIGVAIWALLFRTPAPPAIPDIAPAVEDNAQPTGEGEDKMPQAQGGEALLFHSLPTSAKTLPVQPLIFLDFLKKIFVKLALPS